MSTPAMDLPFLAWDRLVPKAGYNLPVVVEVPANDSDSEPHEHVCCKHASADKPKHHTEDFGSKGGLFKSNLESLFSTQPNVPYSNRPEHRIPTGTPLSRLKNGETPRRTHAPPTDQRNKQFARRTTVTVETYLSTVPSEQSAMHKLDAEHPALGSSPRSPKSFFPGYLNAAESGDDVPDIPRRPSAAEVTTSNYVRDEHKRSLRSSRTLVEEGHGEQYATVTDTHEDFNTGKRRSSTVHVLKDSPANARKSVKPIQAIVENEPLTKVDGLSAEEREVLHLEARLHEKVGFQHLVRATSLVRKEEDENKHARPYDDNKLTRTSSLAKKASQYRNSRLPSDLPIFTASLSTWAMACRAAQAARDVYYSEPSRWSQPAKYTSPDSSEGTKAMIIEDQLVDGSRVIIVSIRGTQFQSLADWAVNYAAKPVKPTGFLDDHDNACHAGFLNVAKAMVALVAVQLQQHPAYNSKPTLLFTGHSAGGAVASILYTHMLSETITSELTIITNKFSSIHCMTFGAPPVSTKTLQKTHDSTANTNKGVFLAFANEGDPVLRLSSAAYLKSLARLLASPLHSPRESSPAPSERSNKQDAPPAKGLRKYLPHSLRKSTHSPAPPPNSRSNSPPLSLHRTRSTTPPAADEPAPVWPVPAVPLANAGNLVLLREGSSPHIKTGAAAHSVRVEDLRDALFGDLSQHTLDVYHSRVNALACAAVMGTVR